jgi:hypothetical protein
MFYKIIFLTKMLLISALGFSQTLARYPLFEDNFSDNRHDWLLGDRARTLALIQNNVFYFEGKRPRYNYSRRKEVGYLRSNQDFEIEIKIRQISGTDQRGYGLEWGGNSMDNNFYEFWLRNDGSYSIDRFEGAYQQIFDYVPYTPSDLVKIDDYNILTIRKIANTAIYLINQTEVFRHLVSNLWGSEIGFITPPLSAIEVDYLRVSTLNNPPKPVIDKAEIPNIWAVIVGVADYQAPSEDISDLTFTIGDAKAMADFYQNPNGGGANPENVTLLLDKKATKTEIINTMQRQFGKAKSNDLIVFYFSGHGALFGPENEDLYLLPHDFSKSRAEESSISYQQIQEILEMNQAKKKIWIMDACHSGGSLSKIAGKTIPDLLKNLVDKDIAIITSSNTGEESLEDDGLERGIFSYFLTLGLTEDAKKADYNKDNLVNILELFQYTREKTTSTVRTKFGRSQTPQIGGRFNVQLPITKIK